MIEIVKRKTQIVPIILSLCDRTGSWSEPYRQLGYDVRQVDIQLGQDLRLLPYPGRVDGILAAPPCTHFAWSGAGWWKKKGSAAVIEGLALVDACLRLVAVCRPKWWALENPMGRLHKWIGPHRFEFHPHDFAGWADDPDAEAYTKKTLLWGSFKLPHSKPVAPVLGSMMHTKIRDPNKRSVTPQGFARAFADANPCTV